MPSLSDLLPEAEAVLSLEPEELGGYLLELFNGSPPQRLDFEAFVNRPNTVAAYPQEHHVAIMQAISEAWSWLGREGLLVRKVGEIGGSRAMVISRRGQKLKTYADVEAFRKAGMLPRGLLHPRIATKVWAQFLRGDYDSAVFQAFKEVEIAVRDAAAIAVRDAAAQGRPLAGTDLVRKAFDSNRGELTDLKAEKAEREARAHLFAGAIGSYKNPSSHRAVVMAAEEAVEMIVLANHLLRIVDAAVATRRGNASVTP